MPEKALEKLAPAAALAAGFARSIREGVIDYTSVSDY
jgi:hypothetical protein